MGLYATRFSRGSFGTRIVSYTWSALLFLCGFLNFLVLVLRLFGSDKRTRMVSDRQAVEISEINARALGKNPNPKKASPAREHQIHLETDRPLITEAEEPI